MNDTVRCEQCGGSSPADGRFCIECGASLPAAATGPTVRLEAPPTYTTARPATPPRPIIVAPPLPPPAPRRRAHGRAPDLAMPLAIIAVALALLFVPRFGAPAVMAIGVGGLLMRGMLTRPDRVLPLLVLLVFVGLLVTGSKLFWPALFLLFVVRALMRGRPF